MASRAAFPSVVAAHRPKLTKTGRISKAMKGLKGAHPCGCGKTYSRAEHLRRHQQNHDKHLPCPLSSCGKKFYRQDLLDRHMATKHNQQMDHSLRHSSVASSNLTTSSYPRPGSAEADIPSLPATTVSADAYAVGAQYIETLPSQHALFPDQSVEPQSPTSLSEAPYVKAEPRQPQKVASWREAAHSTSESRRAYHPTSTSPYLSSGNASPFNPYTVSTPWLETASYYPPASAFDPLCYAYNSAALTSPRTLTSHTQLPGWMESNMEVPAFPASTISSPSSSCAPALAPIMVPQHALEAPYSLTLLGQNDKFSGLDMDSPLEEQQVGIDMSLKTKEHYMEAYWTNFHPLYPILHKSQKTSLLNPLLTAAMMAIGGQYVDEPYARSDSRILHEVCLDLTTKYKDRLMKTGRLDYMQAIFLVEVFSHFKAKRAAIQLSEVFLAIYSLLSTRRENTANSDVEALGMLPSQMDDQSLKLRWQQWTSTMGFERLLTAFYIFETTQALLLARPLLSHPTDGFGLLIPTSSALWDAPTAHKWAQVVRAKPAKVINVTTTLDNMAAHENHVDRYEPFQCALLVACHAASVLYKKHELQSAPFSTPAASHPVFESENIRVLEEFLAPVPHITIMHNMVCLAANTPLRALLAASGESWVLSQRLSQESLVAAAEFTTLKTELRAWTDSTEPSMFQVSQTEHVRSAVEYSLNILAVCLDANPASLAFGSDMALYYACLVFWAVAFGASSKLGVKVENDDTAEFEAPRAERNARLFCDFAAGDLRQSNDIHGMLPANRVDGWRYSVGAVTRWSAWVLGGAGMNSGVGELMEGAVGVLERLGRRGWNAEWF